MRRQWNIRFHHMHPTAKMHEYFESMAEFLKNELPADTEPKGRGAVAQLRLELMAAIIASGMANKNTGVNDRDKFAEVSVAIAEEICREVSGIPTRDDEFD
jgi:hypothetical protein